MAKHSGKAQKASVKHRAAITGRFVSSNRETRTVTDEGIARLRARGASDEFLKAARGER